MNIKVELASLFGAMELPHDEFVELDAYKKLEKEKELIHKLEHFHLPEITRLICASCELLECEWATKYVQLSNLYMNLPTLNPGEVLVNYSDANKFEEEVLSFCYIPINELLKKYCEDIENNQKELKKKSKSLKTKLTNMKKKNEVDGLDNSENLVNLQQEIEKIDGELKKCNAYMKQYKKHFEKINEYIEISSNVQLENENREKAYENLTQTSCFVEEDLLNRLTKCTETSDDYSQNTREKIVCSKILQHLQCEEHKNVAFEIFERLNEYGKIALDDEELCDYIMQHPKELCDYLVEDYKKNNAFIGERENLFLYECAINNMISTENCFSNLWNNFIREDEWNWLLNQLEKQGECEYVELLGKALYSVKGKAARVAIRVICDNEKSKNIALDVISKLMSKRECCEKESVLELLRIYELNEKKMRRKLSIAERKLKSQDQELFSSIYSPMEQLEQLTVDLRTSKGEIKCNLVAQQLMDIVVSLREGLEEMNLRPLVDVGDWKYQNKIEYNPQMHRMIMQEKELQQLIRLRTLGFEYQNEEGELKQYAAQVSVVDSNTVNRADVKRTQNNKKKNCRNKFYEAKKTKNRNKKGNSKGSHKKRG